MPIIPVLCGVLLIAGIVLNGVASGAYIGAGLGPGPRDGLMTGLHAKYGWSIRRARTAVELTVLTLGFLLGGSVGLGTIAFAFGICAATLVFDRSRRLPALSAIAVGVGVTQSVHVAVLAGGSRGTGLRRTC